MLPLAPLLAPAPLELSPLVLLVYPGMYTRMTPTLFGFPFFYWYQFAVVIATAVFLMVLRNSDVSGGRMMRNAIGSST